MHFPYRFAALASILAVVSAQSTGVPGIWSPYDPVINVQNTGSTWICYKVEFTSGYFPTTTTCDSSPGFTVNPGETIIIHPGAGFNGAITAITNNVKGARHEINFASPLNGMQGTWYDVDYQLGMSDSTLGPADGRPRNVNGQQLHSVSGEQNTVAKANAAWAKTTNKAQLLASSYHLQQGSNGQLTRVYMDSNAPACVVQFFQLTASFTGYIGAGSVAGVSIAPNTVQGDMVHTADEKTWFVNTQAMVITAY